MGSIDNLTINKIAHLNSGENVIFCEEDNGNVSFYALVYAEEDLNIQPTALLKNFTVPGAIQSVVEY